MHKLWTSVFAVAILTVGAAAVPTAVLAQDTTPPEIVLLTPPPGVSFTRIDEIPIFAIITDEGEGLDRTSVVLHAGADSYPIPEESISEAGVVTGSLNVGLTAPLGPMTVTVTASDAAGNVGMASSIVEINGSFESAAALVVAAALGGNFSHPGVDRHLYWLLLRADAIYETDPASAHAVLEWVLESVTRRSRVPHRAHLRANFMSDAASEALAAALEEEVAWLLAVTPAPIGDL